MVYLKIGLGVRRQILIVACLLLGNILAGYTIGWSSPMLGKLLDKNQTPLEDVITSFEASWVASAHSIGLLFGLILCGYLANAIGRKSTIIVVSLITLFSFALLTVANNVTWMYIGRALKGCGAIGIHLGNIMYIGEFASSKLRGVFLALIGVFHALGILLVYAVGPFVTFKDVSYIYIGIALVHLSACGYFLIESPVFYVIKGREDEAKRVLRELGREKDIDTELRAMVETHKEDQAVKKWSQLFNIKSNRIALFVTTVLCIVNQAGGVMSVIYYATLIFKIAGSSVDPDLATIILGLTQFAGSIITPLLINRCGRKTLLLVSGAGCSLFLTILGAYFYLESINDASIPSIRWMPMFALISFLFSFSFGVNVIPMALVGEMFRPNVRSVGSAITLFCGTGVGLVTTSTFTLFADAFGAYTPFWIFAAVNVFGFIFTLIFVPETMGKTLMEIETMMRLGKMETSVVSS